QHADYSSRLMRLPRQAFLPVPVGTDEETFKPTDYSPEKTAPLKVFYYGSMLPLHGLDKVCEAALILKDESVLFTLIGGDELTEAGIKDYVGRGARIAHRRRVPFEELTKYISESDV